MKFATLALLLAPAALALPTGSSSTGMQPRQSINTITDQLLFSITLPAFIVRRNAKNPASLDWTSDGCTDSPDNPFNFPFVPACYRHDFGYQNYRAQTRFTESGKLKIDNNFKSDLYSQCDTVSSLTRGVCKALADVYYAAVRAFGGSDTTPGKRDDELVQAYEDAVARYEALVAEAQANGILPVLE
ncbi:prokaryotic phospholipase A2-domain-containing protein [Podospora appendiculata]|uniref:Prokaryotic phospholipase A2-domain-containing protein n=1 Tax=Podospora appendiculata TaxID=314037 RepID=A0AAE0XMP6_9PEZI|nr:prokaryotic phospholipase A2-domain-containing protein [Podospora appendiculata]